MHKFVLLFLFLFATAGAFTDSLTLIQQEPVLIKSVKINYPLSVKKLGITGTVSLQILLDESGTVESVSVISGLHPDLDSQIVKALYSYIFTPAIADDKPVPVIISYEHIVTLADLAVDIKPDVNLKGIVFERGSRHPVADAQVIVSFTDTLSDTSVTLPFSLYLQYIGTFSGQEFLDGTLSTWTDSSGHFYFKSLPAGLACIKVIGSGYEEFQTNLFISGNQQKEVVLRVDKQSFDQNEIVVYGRKEDREISKRSISADEINKVAGFSGDAIKVVQAFPGVARASFGLGAIGIRGAPTWDSRFFLDGIPIPQLYHFGGIKSVYNSDALSSVDLYPGGFGARFGNSIAGVISINSRDAERERVKGFADVNLMDFTLFAEGPVNSRTGLIATVRRSYLGDLIGLAAKKSNILNSPMMIAPYYYDYLARADVDISPSQKIILTLFGSKDALELVVPSLDGGSAEVDAFIDRVRDMNAFNMVMSAYDISIKKNVKNSFRTALIQGLGNGLLFGIVKWDYRYWEFLMRDELSIKITDKIRINGGLDFWMKNHWQTTIFPKPDKTFYRDTIKMNSGIISPFFQAEFSPVPSVTVSSGWRFDYYPELKYHGSLLPEFWNYRYNNKIGLDGEPSLRFSAKYQINNKHTLTAAIGSYNQTPQPLGIATDKTFGNASFPATKARQFMLGYRCQINETVSADVQAYHNRQWDLPVLTGLDDWIWLNSTDTLFSGGGQGRMYGIEFFLRQDLNKRLFGWISYSLSKSERFRKKDNKFIPYDNDQTHNLQCVLHYRFPKKWQVGTRIRLVSGNPYTPIINSVYDATNRYYQPVKGKENSKRNEPFFQTDLRVEKMFLFDKWKLSAYMDLQNALWFMYKSPEMTVYNFDYTEKTTLYIPVIPSIGVKAEY